MAWEKAVKIGKTERYSYVLADWLNGESLLIASVTSSNAVASITSVVIEGDTISLLATGVQAGVQELRINFATATRSDTSPVMKIKVKALPVPV